MGHGARQSKEVRRMRRKRRVFAASFRAKVALAAVKGAKTLAQLADQFEIHPNQVSTWRKELMARWAELFENGGPKKGEETAASQEELYEQIGRLKMEVDWLK